MKIENQMKSKIYGSLIGAVIGDGFGFKTEFMNYEQIITKWGLKGLQAPIGDPIIVTDDTQMAIAVSKAVISSFKNNNINVKDFENSLRSEFITWLNDEQNNRAPGMTCMESCEFLERGLQWEDATDKNSKGCGSNMRVSPIGLLKLKNEQITNTQIAKWSQFQAAITHALKKEDKDLLVADSFIEEIISTLINNKWIKLSK